MSPGSHIDNFFEMDLLDNLVYLCAVV